MDSPANSPPASARARRTPRPSRKDEEEEEEEKEEGETQPLPDGSKGRGATALSSSRRRRSPQRYEAGAGSDNPRNKQNSTARTGRGTGSGTSNRNASRIDDSDHDNDQDFDEDDKTQEGAGELIEAAAWPEAAPHPQAKGFLSISTDGVGWAWTKYDSTEAELHPTVFWRTARLPLEAFVGNAKDVCKDPMVQLRHYFPRQVQEFFFGDSDPKDLPPSLPTVQTKDRAYRMAALRAVPIVNVYVLADAVDSRAIKLLLSEMPVKLYRLRTQDFLLNPLTCSYPVGTSAAQIAAVRGALVKTGYKLPALVILANPDVVAVTAVTSNNAIVGGGITCGILTKLEMVCPESLGTGTTNPSVSDRHRSITSVLEEAKSTNRPFEVLGASVLGRRLVDALQETAAYLDSTILNWKKGSQEELEQYRRDPTAPESKTGINSELTVAVGGVDARIIVDLLKPNHDGLIGKPVAFHPAEGIEAKECTYVIAHGVQSVLLAQYRSFAAVCRASEAERARQAVVGCRIAKFFKSDLYRGSVACVIASTDGFDDDLYRVIYDDNDSEDYSPFELHAHLKRYSSTGEDWANECSDDFAHLLEKKKEQSRTAAGLLLQFSTKLRGEVPPARKVDAAFRDNNVEQESLDAIRPSGGTPTAVVAAPDGAASAPDGAASAGVGAASTASAAVSETIETVEAVVAAAADAATALPAAGSIRKRGRPPLFPSIPKASELEIDPAFVVGRRIAKYFKDPSSLTGEVKLYYGTISKYARLDQSGKKQFKTKKDVIWDVKYDDDDEESLEAKKVIESLQLYQLNSAGDTNAHKRRSGSGSSGAGGVLIETD